VIARAEVHPPHELGHRRPARPALQSSPRHSRPPRSARRHLRTPRRRRASHPYPGRYQPRPVGRRRPLRPRTRPVPDAGRCPNESGRGRTSRPTGRGEPTTPAGVTSTSRTTAAPNPRSTARCAPTALTRRGRRRPRAVHVAPATLLGRPRITGSSGLSGGSGEAEDPRTRHRGRTESMVANALGAGSVALSLFELDGTAEVAEPRAEGRRTGSFECHRFGPLAELQGSMRRTPRSVK